MIWTLALVGFIIYILLVALRVVAGASIVPVQYKQGTRTTVLLLLQQ